MKLPGHDYIVFENLIQLSPARRHHDVRSSAWRQPVPVEIGVVEEVYPVDDDALFGRRQASQHFFAFGYTRVLLNEFVAGAGRNVVAVGPDGRPRIIRK